MPGRRARDPFERSLEEGTALPVSGWDFSPVRGRWRDPGPTWSYRRRARVRLRRVVSALDLGTGGGELLATLAPLPRRTFATEGYPPNLAIARRRLAPLGVRVLPIGSDLRIALPDASVELVLDRHEAFDPREVRRVLAPGGAFLTQQVGADDLAEIDRAFGLPPESPTNRLESARALADEIGAGGLEVREFREARYRTEFLDLAAVVWFLRLAPWQVPGFSIHRDRAALRRIDRTIRRTGAFRPTAHRLLVVARRPPESGRSARERTL
ncbi:MAG TPA: class I SAM-dependent methyltransferase [Thermoplasmata archaeon]|nr:class I SAM-dependent methyltransferase [Thermoplasmata archaeon]